MVRPGAGWHCVVTMPADPPPPAFDAAAYVVQAAALLRLPLDAAHLPGVAANLMVAARMAAIVEAVPLGAADEPAPVFLASR